MNTEGLVREFILNDLRFTGFPDELTPVFPLLEKGILDSVGLVTLVDYLEVSCGIVIDEEDLLPEHFATISDIARFVNTKRVN
jgi:acyl carrier protein